MRRESLRAHGAGVVLLLLLLEPTGRTITGILWGVGGQVATTFFTLAKLVVGEAVVADELPLVLVLVDGKSFVTIPAFISGILVTPGVISHDP